MGVWNDAGRRSGERRRRVEEEDDAEAGEHERGARRDDRPGFCGSTRTAGPSTDPSDAYV